MYIYIFLNSNYYNKMFKNSLRITRNSDTNSQYVS